MLLFVSLLMSCHSQKQSAVGIGYDVNYFVFDHSNGAIIIEDSLRLGSVSWISATQLKAIDRKRDANNKSAKEIYLFDVVTKLKSVQ